MTFQKPQLVAHTNKLPTPLNGDHVMEPKYDGWRIQAHISRDGSVLYTRGAKRSDATPYINAALDRLAACLEQIAQSGPEGRPAGLTILDGEIVDLSGAADRQWNRTASILQTTVRQHVPTADDPPLTFVVFDALMVDGTDVTGEPLATRQEMASRCVDCAEGTHRMAPAPENAVVRFTEQMPASEDGLAALVAEGWEGVVVKDLRSPYRSDDRRYWVAVKPEQTADAICTGTYAAVGAGNKFEDSIGGITFTVTHDDGSTYEGQCAGRMSDALRRELRQQPERFVGQVVELVHWGIWDTGALRMPQFKRFRPDKEMP
jgi:ATP-dependent DNA ligase